MGKYFLIIIGLILIGVGGWYYFTQNPHSDFSLEQLFLSGGTITVFSEDFGGGQRLPPKFTCDGFNVSPTLVLDRVPGNAKSLVIIMDDESLSPTPFTHWIEFNISPSLTRIDSSKILGGATIGINDFGNAQYDGPCPPQNSTHKYYFRVYALDTVLNDQNYNRVEIDKVIKDHIIATGYLGAVYSRLP